MNFKEQMLADVKNVFLNFNEFGERHQINGHDMVIIIDGNEMIEREKKYRENRGRDGTFTERVLFYVSAQEFGPLPEIGRSLILDRKQYQITDAVSESGIYSVSLERTRA